MLAKLGAMEQEDDKIHVISLADDWEVESQSGIPLAHEDEKCDAIDTARKLAQQRGIETVILHHGDGVTEKIPAFPIEETTVPLEADEPRSASEGMVPPSR
jgi:hypothetical protein